MGQATKGKHEEVGSGTDARRVLSQFWAQLTHAPLALLGVDVFASLLHFVVCLFVGLIWVWPGLVCLLAFLLVCLCVCLILL